MENNRYENDEIVNEKVAADETVAENNEVNEAVDPVAECEEPTVEESEKVSEPVEEAVVEEPAEAVTEEPAEAVAEEPAVEAVEEPVKEESVKEPVEDIVVAPEEEPVNEVVESPAVEVKKAKKVKALKKDEFSLDDDDGEVAEADDDKYDSFFGFFKTVKWKRIWDKLSLALLLVAIGIPVGLLAYIILNFFL